jgi:heme exporter protein C
MEKAPSQLADDSAVKTEDYISLSLVFCLETIALYFALVASPPEQTLGELIRIFYTHTPTAWLTYLAFGSSFILTVLFFARRDLRFDRLSEISASLGICFGSAAILTGAIWAKATWGSYWNWDPRETTTLICELAYVGYVMLRMSVPDAGRRAVSSGAYNILAFSTVPLSYLSISFMISLHPVVVTSAGFGLSLPILRTLALNLIAATAIYLYLMKNLYSLSNLSRAVEQLNSGD